MQVLHLVLQDRPRHTSRIAEGATGEPIIDYCQLYSFVNCNTSVGAIALICQSVSLDCIGTEQKHTLYRRKRCFEHLHSSAIPFSTVLGIVYIRGMILVV